MASDLADKLLAGNPPTWLRLIEVHLLMDAFARAFDVEAPSLAGLSADNALTMYREFTAACMELTAPGDPLFPYLRRRLGEEAVEVGRTVRALVPAADPLALARYLYRGIGIELAGSLPGEVRFGPCSFAQRYTPHDCLLMSAFDEGFLRGVSGLDDADLSFSCRLTEGAPCCMARFSAYNDSEGSD